MNKENIDEQAEREAMALHKQGRNYNQHKNRIRVASDYNRENFDKLFKDCKNVR